MTVLEAKEVRAATQVRGLPVREPPEGAAVPVAQAERWAPEAPREVAAGLRVAAGRRAAPVREERVARVAERVEVGPLV